MRFCLPRQFSPVFVCVTQILMVGCSSYSSFPPTPPRHPPPTLISLETGHLSRLWADSPTKLWAIQPTCRELTDFKKAVSQRVNDDLINVFTVHRLMVRSNAPLQQREFFVYHGCLFLWKVIHPQKRINMINYISGKNLEFMGITYSVQRLNLLNLVMRWIAGCLVSYI
jgi:hypothetical protein